MNHSSYQIAAHTHTHIAIVVNIIHWIRLCELWERLNSQNHSPAYTMKIEYAIQVQFQFQMRFGFRVFHSVFCIVYSVYVFGERCQQCMYVNVLNWLLSHVQRIKHVQSIDLLLGRVLNWFRFKILPSLRILDESKWCQR